MNRLNDAAPVWFLLSIMSQNVMMPAPLGYLRTELFRKLGDLRANLSVLQATRKHRTSYFLSS
ncbi:uncharacterized protein PHALS_15282 [Plasmopara halstedii]|uniref:Uncharacterized protein n=1 Tax=Plasmopara halstedii TaxID=4781 RepID=A0A0N7L6K3_PLAHL|nr:uncharacterized protein PHALS_15282 [Plasmopara halstedii]CEG44515.1 hypothetical protein PHALS_15282 [Plasmopara halstedii]|eukprot:XP_024580884.1 hypothetical protein PHALS_15282 [Plasmopara halstedii]